MKPLKGILERRAVTFVAHVGSDFDDVVGPNTDNPRVECAVVDCAHCDAVGHHRLSSFRVLLYVRRIQ